MNNWLEYIRNNHISIYRISLFLIAIALTLYIMPRKKSFIFDAVEGRPWPHENLISDMEFSIQKSAEEINLEKAQVSDQNKFCFYLDTDKKIEGEKKLNYQLERFFNKKNQNQLKSKSEKKFNKYQESLKKKIISLWNNIYKKGVITNNGNIDGKEGNYVVLLDNSALKNYIVAYTIFAIWGLSMYLAVNSGRFYLSDTKNMKSVQSLKLIPVILISCVGFLFFSGIVTSTINKLLDNPLLYLLRREALEELSPLLAVLVGFIVVIAIPTLSIFIIIFNRRRLFVAILA